MAKCLIVEDSEVIRLVARHIFEELGHEALEAGTAEEGILMCRDENVDCVFLDWDMPQLDALDFLQGVIKEENFTGEIVLCATENEPKQFALARAAGARYHLLKPFDPPSVRAVLMQVGIGLEEEQNQSPGAVVEA